MPKENKALLIQIVQFCIAEVKVLLKKDPESLKKFLKLLKNISHARKEIKKFLLKSCHMQENKKFLKSFAPLLSSFAAFTNWVGKEMNP